MHRLRLHGQHGERVLFLAACRCTSLIESGCRRVPLRRAGPVPASEATPSSPTRMHCCTHCRQAFYGAAPEGKEGLIRTMVEAINQGALASRRRACSRVLACRAGRRAVCSQQAQQGLRRPRNRWLCTVLPLPHAGCTFFDTAELYNVGLTADNNEQLLGPPFCRAPVACGLDPCLRTAPPRASPPPNRHWPPCPRGGTRRRRGGARVGRAARAPGAGHQVGHLHGGGGPVCDRRLARALPVRRARGGEPCIARKKHGRTPAAGIPPSRCTPGSAHQPAAAVACPACLGPCREAVEASLRNLGVEYIDLYYLHRKVGWAGRTRRPPTLITHCPGGGRPRARGRLACRVWCLLAGRSGAPEARTGDLNVLCLWAA